MAVAVPVLSPHGAPFSNVPIGMRSAIGRIEMATAAASDLVTYVQVVVLFRSRAPATIPGIRLLSMDSESQKRYREDSVVLRELGAVLARSDLPIIEVRLPQRLALIAIAAWERDEDQGPDGPESCEQRLERSHAGTLALIGLSIQEGGHEENDDVVVELDVRLIGAAVEASDEVPPS